MQNTDTTQTPAEKKKIFLDEFPEPNDKKFLGRLYDLSTQGKIVRTSKKESNKIFQEISEELEATKYAY